MNCFVRALECMGAHAVRCCDANAGDVGEQVPWEVWKLMLSGVVMGASVNRHSLRRKLWQRNVWGH